MYIYSLNAAIRHIKSLDHQCLDRVRAGSDRLNRTSIYWILCQIWLAHTSCRWGDSHYIFIFCILDKQIWIYLYMLIHRNIYSYIVLIYNEYLGISRTEINIQSLLFYFAVVAYFQFRWVQGFFFSILAHAIHFAIWDGQLLNRIRMKCILNFW